MLSSLDVDVLLIFLSRDENAILYDGEVCSVPLWYFSFRSVAKEYLDN